MKTSPRDTGPNGNKHRLYPTFKEWKLVTLSFFIATILRLYPTFKEWKPFSESSEKALDEVYILPLRNENRSKY